MGSVHVLFGEMQVESSTKQGGWDGGRFLSTGPVCPRPPPELFSWSQVVIRRRPLFYAVNLLLPSIFLMVMDIVGFYLPPESGERVSFKITLLLGYSVFLIIVSDTLPATAIGTPLIGKACFWGRARRGQGSQEWTLPPPLCLPPPPSRGAQVSTLSCAWLCW